MRISKLALKELLQNIRNPKIILLMTFLPLLIILLLGIAISSAFSASELTMSNIDIEYVVSGTKTELTYGIETVLKSLITGDDQLNEVSKLSTSLNRLQDNDIACVIEINENTQTINFYENKLYHDQASVIEGVLLTYVDRYNLIVEIKEPIVVSNTSYTRLKQVNSTENVSAMDYYGIAICVLFVLYGVPMPLSSVMKDKHEGTISRMLLSPVKTSEMILGKTLGGLIVGSIQMGFVMLGTLIIFNVNWGSNPLYAFILILTMVFMGVSLGVFLGFLFESEDKATVIIHVFIAITAFFGGSYMPLEGLGFIGEVGKYFSPIWWNNYGLFNLIYGNDIAIYYQAMGINIGVAVLFVALTALKLRRKEALLNG